MKLRKEMESSLKKRGRRGEEKGEERERD